MNIGLPGATCVPSKPIRPDWDQYFMRIAHVISSRATCNRRQVGAVITHKNRIISCGYNGSIRGQPHCLDVGCEMVNGHCVRCVHAEMNAVLSTSLDGRKLQGGTCYTTSSPCRNCFNALAQVGIRRIVFVEQYCDQSIYPLAKDLDIELKQIVCEVK